MVTVSEVCYDRHIRVSCKRLHGFSCIHVYETARYRSITISWSFVAVPVDSESRYQCLTITRRAVGVVHVVEGKGQEALL